MERSFPLVILILCGLAFTACGAGTTPDLAAEPPATPIPAVTDTVTLVPTAKATATSGTDNSSLSRPDAMATLTVPEATLTFKPREAGEYMGVVFAVGEGSEITFTVEEQLAKLPLPNDAVLRTNTLSGNVSLDGDISTIAVDLHTLRSDATFRDRYVKRTMFPNHQFATLIIPSILPLPDGFANGNEASSSVTGNLSIKGKEVPVIFEVVARDDGETVFILAKTVVTWAQLQMPVPTARSVVSVEDEIKVEVLLAVRP